MIEPYEETIDGVDYRITIDKEDVDGIDTFPATVWRQDDAGTWRVLFHVPDGAATPEEATADCLVRLKARLF